MTTAAARALQTVKHKPEIKDIKDAKDAKNAVQALNFRTIKPIERTEIPIGRGRDRGLSNLTVVKEFNALLDLVVKEGINPYEVAGEIDMNTVEIKMQKSLRKSFTQTFRGILRTAIEEKGLKGKINIMEFNHGEKFFIIGQME